MRLTNVRLRSPSLRCCGPAIARSGSTPASMFSLYESTEAMKQELELSKKDAAALEGAIDVLVGDATREMLAQAEAAGEDAARRRGSRPRPACWRPFTRSPSAR